jgi:hypothetical protein
MNRHLVCAAVALLFASACGPTVDLTRGLQVEGMSSGWYESGVVDGTVKLVPLVSFKLKNVSEQKLPTLQVNAVFRRDGDESEWGSGFVTATGTDGLPPGSATATLTVTSQLGYTGTDSRYDLLKNSHFVDARVDLFAKYGSTQWTRLGAFPISRQLVER